MYRFHFTLAASLTCCLGVASGQEVSCGTVVTPTSVADLSRMGPLHLDPYLRTDVAEGFGGTDTLEVPIVIHRLARTDGTGAATVGACDSAVANLNRLFAPGAIRFTRCRPDALVANDTFFQYTSTQESRLRRAYEVPGVLNIYIPNEITDIWGKTYCGYSYLPSIPRDVCLLASSCLGDGSTLAHELGHYLGLYHTHGKTDCGPLTDELVDGSNCRTAGDEVCDTPADPNLEGEYCRRREVSSFCRYTGTRTDSTGQAFAPDVTNLMSYGRKTCLDHFTEGQYDRMRHFLSTARAYLSCGRCEASAPVVSSSYSGADYVEFTWSGSTPGAPLTVEYTVGTTTRTAQGATDEAIRIDGLEACDSLTARARESCSLTWSATVSAQTPGCEILSAVRSPEPSPVLRLETQNPFLDRLAANVSGGGGEASFSVYDVNGVRMAGSTGVRFYVDAGGWTPGLYILRVVTQDGAVAERRLVKQ